MKLYTASFLIIISVLALSLSGFAQEKTPAITKQELQAHIKYLASEELGGRGSGSDGNKLAAEYIANEFKLYGLQPKGANGYFQEFDFISTVKVGESNSLSMKYKGNSLDFKLDETFRPLGFTADTSVSGSLVFVGYGISADTLHYDDYAGVDVKDKIVVMMRYSPNGNKDSTFTRYTAPRMKAMTARNKGAAGVIFVMGPIDDTQGKLMPFSFDRGMGTSGIAAITMPWTAFDSILHLAGKDIRTIQETINQSKQPQSFELNDVSVSMQTQTVKVHDKTANVVGYLEGSDPKLKNEIVAIGAHFDHLGMGGEGSLKPDTVAVHHGADDNASGSAGLLELAQYCVANKEKFKRSLLFLAFSGEELGLLGANDYVEKPTVQIENIITMINMDMIGRMHDSGLVVEGMGTSPGFETLVKETPVDPTIKLVLKQDGYGPSDHAAFYSKNMPVMFFFTGTHEDYHKPSDTWDKINYDGEQKIVTFVSLIAEKVANLNEKPAFTKAATTPMGGDRPGASVTLGVTPDYSTDVPGLKISGTRKDGPAEKAGLLGGDIIIKFGGKDVKNIYDYMYLLGDHKPGEEVEVVVKRGDKELKLRAILTERK